MITNSFASVPVKEETRKKYCRFRKNGIRYVDYKDPDFLLKLVNEQGKLLVPKDLSEKAGIEADSEVVLAGRGIHFEIWSKANFERVLNIETREDESDDLGIF